MRDQKKMIVEIQNQRINEAKNYGVELREIERDVLDSLKDVLNLLDRLESSDVRSSKQVKELKNKLSDQHDKILTNLENLG